ncbi:MAG: hypothetical protein OEW60_06800 [Thiovulaceae bacterium]|nr:hypothetical protein [Sulfurimonadaceae bacterium]
MRFQQQLAKELRKMPKKISIDPKALKIRSRVELFKVIEGSKFGALIGVAQKSRILVKDVSKFDDILKKMIIYCDHTFDSKKIIIDAPLCSKAKAKLLSEGWEVLEAG